ncbi:unnamed protein product [Adineta steineri]|uniref:Uncharacterized protein n=1 Tax=Adineta steineri TaxID=433720 RepID=A0A819Y0S3_9BILA|nr:unnamed protein product [Adineta steineri]
MIYKIVLYKYFFEHFVVNVPHVTNYEVLVGLCEMDREKYISPVYHASRSTPDGLEHFKEEFGYFYGKCLYTQVTQLCQQPRSTTQPA